MKRAVPMALAIVLPLAAQAQTSPATPAQPAADGRPDIVVSPADKQLAIGNLRTAIVARHFSEKEGRRIASEIDKLIRSPRYTAVTSGRELAMMLTADLRRISGDPHFLVDYFARARPFPMPADSDRPDDPALGNWGVVAADRLPGNIGYLRVDKFAPIDGAGPVLGAAMATLKATDALVIDLRKNGGGYSQTANLLSAYFVPDQTRLNDIESRDGTMQGWTPPVPPAARYLDKPVYVLVSPRTFSAAEGFAYGLRALGRVTIVGQPTRGGANPVERVQLSSRFWAMVPVARARNPITGTNWGGVGVKPDIAVDADAALDIAQRDAAKRLLPKHRDDPLTRELAALAGADSKP